MDFADLRPTSRFHANLLYGGVVPTVTIREYDINLDDSFNSGLDTNGNNNGASIMPDVWRSETDTNVCMSETTQFCDTTEMTTTSTNKNTGTSWKSLDHNYSFDSGLGLDQPNRLDVNETNESVVSEASDRLQNETLFSSRDNNTEKSVDLQSAATVKRVYGKIDLNSPQPDHQHPISSSVGHHVIPSNQLQTASKKTSVASTDSNVTSDNTETKPEDSSSMEGGYRFKRSPVIARRPRMKTDTRSDGKQEVDISDSNQHLQHSEQDRKSAAYLSEFQTGQNTETLTTEPTFTETGHQSHETRKRSSPLVQRKQQKIGKQPGFKNEQAMGKIEGKNNLQANEEIWEKLKTLEPDYINKCETKPLSPSLPTTTTKEETADASTLIDPVNRDNTQQQHLLTTSATISTDLLKEEGSTKKTFQNHQQQQQSIENETQKGGELCASVMIENNATTTMRNRPGDAGNVEKILCENEKPAVPDFATGLDYDKVLHENIRPRTKQIRKDSTSENKNDNNQNDIQASCENIKDGSVQNIHVSPANTVCSVEELDENENENENENDNRTVLFENTTENKRQSLVITSCSNPQRVTVIKKYIQPKQTIIKHNQRAYINNHNIQSRKRQQQQQHHQLLQLRRGERKRDSSSSPSTTTSPSQLFIIRKRNNSFVDSVFDDVGLLSSYVAADIDSLYEEYYTVRRRSLSADDIPTLTLLEQEQADEKIEKTAVSVSENSNEEPFSSNADYCHYNRRKSLSCNDLHLYYSALVGTTSDCESESDGNSTHFANSEEESEDEVDYVTDSSGYEDEESSGIEDGDNSRTGLVNEAESDETVVTGKKDIDIHPFERQDEKVTKETHGTRDNLDTEQKHQVDPTTHNSTTRKRQATKRRHSRKQRSFIAKSVSVDLRPQNDRYFTNIRNRRNGIVTGEEGELNKNTQDDFIGDLIEFKRAHKKSSKKTPLHLVKSVESLFDKAAALAVPSSCNNIPLRPDSARKDKPKKHFLSGLFTRNGKMDFMRETSILNDDNNKERIDKSNGTRPRIDVVEETSQKVAGVIELFVDEYGDVIRKIEIIRIPGQSLGFFIRNGNGVDRTDGIFISRVTLGSFVDENNLLHYGDEILQINKV